MYCVSDHELNTGTSEDPDINVMSNEAYGVSSGVGQSAYIDYVCSTVIIYEAESNRAETTANIEMRPIQGNGKMYLHWYCECHNIIIHAKRSGDLALCTEI